MAGLPRAAPARDRGVRTGRDPQRPCRRHMAAEPAGPAPEHLGRTDRRPSSGSPSSSDAISRALRPDPRVRTWCSSAAARSPAVRTWSAGTTCGGVGHGRPGARNASSPRLPKCPLLRWEHELPEPCVLTRKRWTPAPMGARLTLQSWTVISRVSQRPSAEPLMRDAACGDVPFPDERSQVAVVEYRPQWPAEFELLAGRLRGALGDSAFGVDHVGSTSVPGLAAKDCVDVQVRMRSIDEARDVPLLAAIGFRCRPEPWNRIEVSGGRECRKFVFAPPVGARSCNVHLREGTGPNARFALLFRDYLRADETACRARGAF
ncbi:GrpB family protein [Streptomyces sp. JV184]|uniref:GrpB family protein n=1 Tax=Streptomyces sp. JV184 TaxID=858637 RepID=UPI002E75BF62|nr:GrpB family protein [Streptomyces sp. JV184]